MEEASILIGGKAGEGINQAGAVIGRILNQLGYYIYIYFDYPSLIRGGHNFSIIRASKEKIASHRNKIDFLLVLNQDCIELHKKRLKDNTLIIYDQDAVHPVRNKVSNGVHSEGIALPLEKIIKEENAQAIMRNSCIIGGFCKVAGIEWAVLEKVFRKNIPKNIELNLKVARRGYDDIGIKKSVKLETLDKKMLPLLTGNEAIGLGLVEGGLKAYIAYPMTPSSSLLHFMAEEAPKTGIKVIHPESEIGVILMALGFSYCGEKTAVGTSGGGFCLMTEGLSLSGMTEQPVVIVLGQRPGPSTGVPTYTAQGDLHFAINAGQGEFVRFVVAPGDSEEAFYWSEVSLNISWKFQIPSIILSDKTLSEGTFSFNRDLIKDIKEEEPTLWDRNSTYKRYLDTPNGISPLTFAPDKDAIIKVNSYEHDEYGITTEEAQKIKAMQDKRLRKEKYLIEELERYEAVKIYGNKESKIALLSWGSQKGVSTEVAAKFNIKVVQPVVLWPFPVGQFEKALKGVEKIIAVENNATSQLVRLIQNYGFNVDKKVLKYDGRPFSLDELEEDLKKVL